MITPVAHPFDLLGGMTFSTVMVGIPSHDTSAVKLKESNVPVPFGGSPLESRCTSCVIFRVVPG